MSGTVIDALVVELGLDTSKFTTGQKAAVEGLRKLPDGIERINQTDAKATREKAQREQQAGRDTDRGAKDAERKRRDELRAKDRDRATDTKSEGEAAKQRAKHTQEFAKAQKESWNLAKEAALGFGAAFAAVATADLFKNTAQNVADLGRTAYNLGLATPIVQAWANAVQTAGGSADAAVGSLQGLQKGLGGLRVGDTSLLGPLNEIGAVSGHAVDLKDNKGQFVDELELLMRLAEATKGMDPSLRAVELGKLVDPGTMNAMRGGRAGMDAEIAAAQQRGVPTGREADLDAKLQKATVELEQQFTRLGQVLVVAFGPGLIETLSNFGSVLSFLTSKFTDRPLSWDDVRAQYAQHHHDAAVDNHVLGGMSRADAERQAMPGAPAVPQGASPWPQADASGSHWPWVGRFLDRNVVQPVEGLMTRASGDVGSVPDFVRSDAAKKGLDPNWLASLFRAEGGGYRNISPTGNFGPAQLSADVARKYGVATNPNAPGYDWHKNAAAGLDYFRMLLSMFGNRYDVATLAYHDGPNAASTLSYAATGSEGLLGPQARRYLEAIKGMAGPHLALPDWDKAGPYARQAQLNMSPAPSLSSGGGFAPGGQAANETINETTIGAVNVSVPDAHDANAIVAGIRDALSSHPLIVQASHSLQ